jgi:hypothetical protein
MGAGRIPDAPEDAVDPIECDEEKQPCYLLSKGRDNVHLAYDQTSQSWLISLQTFQVR